MPHQFARLKIWLGSILLVAAMVAGLVFLWQKEILPTMPPMIEANIGQLFPQPTATVKLAVPVHYQEHALSCEAASLQMALAFYGIPVKESDLIAQMRFDKTRKSDGVWGDPQTGFVGSIDGQMLDTGYGIYWYPIADLANHWAGSKVLYESSAEELSQNIAAGHPIVVWGFSDGGFKKSWRTPAGKRIEAVNGEHARVIVGFAGSVAHPDGFFVIDPIYGRQYWRRTSFLRNWDVFDRAGVVVFPPMPTR
jgi:uncharacterized protein YvpB